MLVGHLIIMDYHKRANMISFVSTSSSLIIIALLPSLKTPIMLIFVPTKISLLSFLSDDENPQLLSDDVH